MLNSYTFNSTTFNSVSSGVSVIIAFDTRMYADIYINNEQLNLTVDNKQMSVYVNNDSCELMINGK